MSSPGRTETAQSTNSSANGNGSTTVSSSANSSPNPALSSTTANSKTTANINNSTSNPTSTGSPAAVVTTAVATSATSTTSATVATSATSATGATTGTRSPNQRTTQASPTTTVSKVVPAADSSPTAGVTAVRQSKPRPLILQHSSAISVSSSTGGDPFIPTVAPHFIMQQSNATMTTNQRPVMLHEQHQGPMGSDELMQLMQTINQAVRNGQFNQQLSNQISRLHMELKNYGDGIEQMHKEELNRVFVSLRQACCRDSGHLGTPCRLKIMELIELRAMGWRSNLQHSQYYINREQFERQDTQHQAMMTDLGPISAPPLMPMNPFAFMQQGIVPANELVTNGQGVAAATSAAPQYYLTNGQGVASATSAAPQYYIIQTSLPPSTVTHAAHHANAAGLTFVTQAGGNVPTLFHQPNPAAFAPHFSAAPPPSAPPTQTQHYPPPQLAMGHHAGATGAPANASGITMNGSEGHFPRGAMFKQSAKYQRPYRIPNKNQFRDEIIIRNADSGKIMGVKGRRVAVVEELTKTIISFQKVPNGAKERTLTITGQDEASIEYAKQLIDQTIRRNASPARPDGEAEGHEGPNEVDENDHEDDEENEELRPLERHSLNLRHGGAGHAQEDLALALNCDDPELLKITKEALKEYFERHTELRRSLTYSASDKASRLERKERRKSMPPMPDTLLQAQAMLAGGAGAGVGVGSGSPTSANSSGSIIGDGLYANPSANANVGASAGKSKKFQSTPNLVEADDGSMIPVHGTRSEPYTIENRRGVQQQQRFVEPQTPADGEENFEDKANNALIVDRSGGAHVAVDNNRNRLQMRVVYTRDFLLQCSLSPMVQVEPPDFCTLPEDCRENLVRDPPGIFNPVEYKVECAKMKQMQIQPTAAAVPMH